jgi:hypothetical protein
MLEANTVYNQISIKMRRDTSKQLVIQIPKSLLYLKSNGHSHVKAKASRYFEGFP